MSEIEKMRREIERDQKLLSVKNLELKLLELEEQKGRLQEQIKALKDSLVETK